MNLVKIIVAMIIILSINTGCASVKVPKEFSINGKTYYDDSVLPTSGTKEYYVVSCWRQQRISDKARVLKQNTALTFSALAIGGGALSAILSGTLATNESVAALNEGEEGFLASEMVILGTIGVLSISAATFGFGAFSVLLASPQAVEYDIKSTEIYSKKKNFAIRSTVAQIQSTSACE